jgi:predicted nucleotidyltransferase
MPRDDSDVDLLVVMAIPESETRAKAVEIRRRILRRFRFDLIVRTPDEIAYRVAHSDWFLRDVIERGRVLYETASIR